MSQRRRHLSTAISALPETFDLAGLVAATAQLLRRRDVSPGQPPSAPPPSGPPPVAPPASIPPPPPPLSLQEVEQFIARGLVDPPEAGDRPFGHRHLLQIVAIQNLRGLQLPNDRIRELVQGVDDGYLKMLCDEPAEAEKKAAVMSNWLKMLSNGRVGQAERGETQLLNAPGVDRDATVALPAVAQPKRRGARNLGIAPKLELSLDKTPQLTRNLRQLAETLPGKPLGPGPIPADLPNDLPTDFAPTSQPRHDAPDEQATPRPSSLHYAAKHRPVQPRTREMPGGQPSVPASMPASDAPTDVAPIAPQAWTRLRLADGVELHVLAGHQPLSVEAIDRIAQQVRELLGG